MKRVLPLLIASRLLAYFLPLLLSPAPDPGFNRWDAPHYLYIAQHWYAGSGDPANFIVFPPLFPLSIRLISLIVSDYEVAALLLSNILFVLGGIVFYKLVSKVYSRHIATLATIFLGIFPTSYFFSAPYTESLFILLSTGVFFLVHKKQWLWASVIASLAMLTRHIGILLIIPIIYEWLHQTSPRLRPARKTLLGFLKIILPFLVAISSYLEINFLVLGNPLAFQSILQNHWQKGFAFPWESLVGSLKNAIVYPPNDYSVSVGIWESVPAIFAILLIPSAYKYLKTSWAHYYTAYTLFILSTNFLLSTPRYLLSNIPMFVVLAFILQKRKVMFSVWIFISTSLLSYFAIRFASGPWAF